MSLVPNSSIPVAGRLPGAREGRPGCAVEESGPGSAGDLRGGAGGAGGGRRALRAVGAAVVRAARGLRWYMTTLMGDTAYATYVAHQRRHHPDEQPVSERRFWRDRMDDQDRNPGARCC